MSQLRGILYKTLAVALFTVMAALIKGVSDEVPTGEAVFFRSFFAIPLILGWLAARGDLPDGLKVTSPKAHIWRGLIGVAAMGLGFTSLRLLPLPEVTAIGFAAPILAVALAAILLGERVRVFRWSAAIVGLVGVSIIISPRLSFGSETLDTVATFGALAALASAILRALVQVTIRRMVQTETPTSVAFYFSVMAATALLVTLPFGWVVPDILDATLMICAGLVGGVAQILVTTAYRHASASLIAPFDYASMLFALGIGYFIFAEVPSMTMLAGSALVIGAGIAIVLRETRLGVSRAASRSARGPDG